VSLTYRGAVDRYTRHSAWGAIPARLQRSIGRAMIMLFTLAFIAAGVAGIFGAFIIKVAPLLYRYRRRPASAGRRAAYDPRAAPQGGRG
jgi:hypothetical protein